MAGQRRIFHVIDVTKFARPSVRDLDVPLTAANIGDRLSGVSFLGYGAVWSRMHSFVRGAGDAAFLEREFSFYRDEWKNRCLRDVGQALNEFFAGRGSWYPHPQRPVPILGTLFRPAINGVWFVDGRPHDVLINPRKGQRQSSDDEKFLARAVYELHGRDDPNDPDQLIIDLSAEDGAKVRSPKFTFLTPDLAISLEEFEIIMRRFFMALAQAGVAAEPAADQTIRDLLKRPGG